MKNFKVFVLLLTLAFLPQCSSSEKNTSAAADFQSKSTFKLHNYTTGELENGLSVLFIEDHSLPSISYGLMIKEGSATDPMTKSGLAELMAQTMVRGSQNMNASQIADQLGQLGSEIDRDVSSDYLWFQVSGLSQHGSKLLDIFSEVLLHPRFEESEINRERANIVAAIKQRPDHPDLFAEEAFAAYLFGSHPYARPSSGTEADLKSISRKDLFRDYKHLFRPNNAVLVVTGDFTPAINESLKAHFGAWVRVEQMAQAFPAPPAIKGVNLRLIDKPDLTQSQIIIGNLGIKRNDPDFLKLRVANVILGGNFYSRLMERVRVNLGLTYGISSQFEGEGDRGPFIISTFTKNQSIGATISESLKVLKQFCDGGVTGKEVDDAKSFLMGAFPRAIETPERLGFNLALLRLYGIGDDYLKNFVDNVAAISASQVNDAIKMHVNPADLKIVVFSKASDALEQLRPLGLVEVKKFSEVF